MILELVATLAATLLSWVLDTMPDMDPPAWVDTGRENVADVMDYASAFSYWVPVNLIIPVVAAVGACAATGLAVKVSRTILSLLTAGGGSAG